MSLGRIVLGLLVILIGVPRAHASHPEQLEVDPFPPAPSAFGMIEPESERLAVGTRAVALILINYADQVNPVSVAMETTTAARIAAAYAAASYGTLQLDVDVLGPYTVAQPSGVCLGFAPPQAETMALAAGVPLDQYVHRIFIVPPSPCPFMGVAVMGTFPNRAYINGSVDLRVHLHELGHLLGMQHSHALKCQPRVSLCSPGTHVEYGDRWDWMGDGTTAHHPNAAQKIQLGWLDPLDVGPGAYTLGGVQQVGSALRIRRAGLAEDLIVEYRAAPLRKVLVHLQRATPGPYLLHMALNGNFALAVGKVWTDPQTGQTLLVEALTDTTARVRVGP